MVNSVKSVKAVILPSSSVFEPTVSGQCLGHFGDILLAGRSREDGSGEGLGASHHN